MSSGVPRVYKNWAEILSSQGFQYDESLEAVKKTGSYGQALQTLRESKKVALEKAAAAAQYSSPQSDGSSPAEFRNTGKLSRLRVPVSNATITVDANGDGPVRGGLTRVFSLPDKLNSGKAQLISSAPNKGHKLIMPSTTPVYKIGDRVELQRSNGSWTKARVLRIGKKALLVQYRCDGAKYQKKLPIRSTHLAPLGTNIIQRDDDAASVVSEFQAPNSPAESWASGKSGKSTATAKSIEIDDGTESIRSGVQNVVFKAGDLVKIERNDGKWYNGKVIKTGSKAVLVEYKVDHQRFQKKISKNSRHIVLRDTDTESVASMRSSMRSFATVDSKVGSRFSMPANRSRPVAKPKIEIVEMAAEFGRELKSEFVPRPAKQVEKTASLSSIGESKLQEPKDSVRNNLSHMKLQVLNQHIRKNPSEESLKLQEPKESISKNPSLESLNAPTIKGSEVAISTPTSQEYKAGDLVQIMRSDGFWYEGKISRIGTKAAVVEYWIDGSKHEKKLGLDSKHMMPLVGRQETNVGSLEVGDDVEFLAAPGVWVRANVVEESQSWVLLLFMYQNQLVERKVNKDSRCLGRATRRAAPVAPLVQQNQDLEEMDAPSPSYERYSSNKNALGFSSTLSPQGKQQTGKLKFGLPQAAPHGGLAIARKA